MKFKSIFTVFLCSVVLFSCSKEDEIQDSTLSNSKLGPSISKVSFPGSGLADMLCFPSMEFFDQTQFSLEEQVESHDANFENQYGNLDEDDLIDFEEDSGYDDELPLIEFEQSHDFNSLRRHVINQENIWLDQFGVNDNFDVSDSPYNHFIFDEEQRAMLNVDAQAKIGEYLVQFTRFGYIQVPISEMELFLNVVNDPSGSSGWMTDENVLIVGGYYGSPAANLDIQSLDPDSNGIFCIADIDSDGQIVYTDNRKVSWRHKLRGSYIFTKAKAKTRGFKHKRGKWRCRRLNINVGLEKEISANTFENCDVYEILDENKSKKRRKVKVNREIIHSSGRLIKFKAINQITKSVHGWSVNETDKLMLEI